MERFYTDILRPARDIAFDSLTALEGPAPGKQYLSGVASADDLIFQQTQFSRYNAANEPSRYNLRSRDTHGFQKQAFDFHLDRAMPVETAAAVHASKTNKGLSPAEIRHVGERYRADRRRLAVVCIAEAAEEGGDFMIYRGRNSADAFLNRGAENAVMKVHVDPGDVIVFDAEHLWHSVSAIQRGTRLSIVQLFEVSGPQADSQ
jgi:hypothetical protein